MLHHGDCLEVLKTIPENSIDSIVTDPPYGLAFMGKKWDYHVPNIDVWREAIRVLKPGGYLLSFGGTRTYHRLACAIEDAGFEIRDQLQWLFGQGFPKSLDVKKSAKDLACGCEEISEPRMRSVSQTDLSTPVDSENQQNEILQQGVQKQGVQSAVLWSESKERIANGEQSGMERRCNLQAEQGKLHRSEVHPMSEGIPSNGPEGRLRDGTPHSYGDVHGENAHADGSGAPQGSQYAEQLDNQPPMVPRQSSPQTCGRCGKAIFQDGLGTALKPANEPIVLARKPLSEKTVAANVLKWGTGGINVDGCRVSTSETLSSGRHTTGDQQGPSGYKTTNRTEYVQAPQGRFPSNLLLDETAAEMLNAQTGTLKSGAPGIKRSGNDGPAYGSESRQPGTQMGGFGDSGGASRFFYVAKASKRERNEGLDGIEIINVSLGEWESADLKATLQVDTGQSPPRVIDASGTLHKDVSEWNTCLFGNSTSEHLPTECKSTTKTETNSTTESKTLNWLLRLNTSASIPDASLSTENGGSLAVPAEFLLQLPTTTSDATVTATSASDARLLVRLQIKSAGTLKSAHPTVKPITLMRYLCRLITPPGGIVLDPFAGSGSTGVAALKEGFQFVGIERELEYIQIAEKRLEHARKSEKI